MHRIHVYTIKQVRESSRLYDVESTIRGPKAAADLVERVFGLSEETVEVLGILTLNTKNKVVGAHIVSRGNLNSTMAAPREIFRLAILNNAAGILLWHNHPSGDPAPSIGDLEVTQRLIEAGNLMGIQILDHVITGEEGEYYSLREHKDAEFNV